MKKLFTLLSVVIALSASAQKTLIHYWNFNAVIDANFPASPYDTSRATQLTPTVSLVPGASLNYTGAYTDVVNDSGNTTNLRVPETSGILENALRVRSAYAPFILSLPTTGYKNIVVEYGIYKSGKGSDYNTITYTTDGVHWDSAGLIISYNSNVVLTVYPAGTGTYPVLNATGAPLDSVALDFSNIPGVNDNPNFKIQITYDNALAGNDRYDNLSVEGVSTALAISLQSFSGAIVDNSAKLNWASSNEVNAKEYAIESSTDGKNFATIGTVAAKNLKGTNSYDFESAAPTTTSYYRLKMIDNNGSFTYSAVVVLNASVSTKKITVFPNPAANFITLSHTEAVDDAIVKVLSANGKVVSTTSIQKGATQTTVDVSKLAKGSYIVSFESNGERTTTQFVK